MVDVKHYKIESLFGEREFRNEIQMLSQLRHPHLVSLVGYCHERNEMFIVLEYMRRGSLDAFLFGMDSVSLAWKHRIQICIGAARGLHYLHTGAKYAVIHRNIKSANILLDDECSCKLSDFSLSKMGPLSMSKTLIRKDTQVLGTYGYAAPEYIRSGELTEKSDVYSFGVVLFEVLSGRRVIDHKTLPTQVLLDWASELMRKGTISHVIDPCLKGRIAPDCFKKYLEIACSCVHDNRNERPDMGEVEVTLELALELQEKADSEESINPYAECMYEEAKICASVSNFGLKWDYLGGGCLSEQDSDSDNNS